MNTVNVNFDKVSGQIKPLHGVCCAPYSIGAGSDQKLIQKYFTEGNIPYCRLHDCCGSYGGSYFVDIPNVFPDFDADENNPSNYDFHYTDEYIKAIQNSGCEAYYRLGVTIEWGSKKYTSVIPADFTKWARICEHIIKHYNEGWANGFNYNIKYWEIWNEPENPGNANGPCMWSGTKEEFYELYKITSNHLKSKFPYIKVGGYGSCGFYTVTRGNYRESFMGFVPFFTDFLEMVRKENCPLDFFSWHIYTNDEKELLAHAKYVRETLDNYGFSNTESHLNEWNVNGEGEGFLDKHNEFGASFDAAVMALLQNTNYVDKAMYYDFSLYSIYNGFINQNEHSLTDVPWYSFVSFGRLYKLGHSAYVETGGTVYATAATNGSEYGIIVSNYSAESKETEINIKGCTGSGGVSIRYINNDSHFEEKINFTSFAVGTIRLNIPKYTVVFITISKENLS